MSTEEPSRCSSRCVANHARKPESCVRASPNTSDARHEGFLDGFGNSSSAAATSSKTSAPVEDAAAGNPRGDSAPRAFVGSSAGSLPAIFPRHPTNSSSAARTASLSHRFRAQSYGRRR